MSSDGRQVQQGLAELLNLAREELGTRQLSELPDLVFGGILASTAEHCTALLDLGGTLAARSCEVILRSIVDGWITGSYVVQDDVDARTRSYAARGFAESLRFYRRLKRLVQTDTRNAGLHLQRANLASERELDQQIGNLETQTVEIRRNGVAKFPTLADCARALGPEFEYMYLWFFGFMLSDRVHLGPRTALSYFSPKEQDAASRRRQVRQVLVSALTLELNLMRLASDYFGRPAIDRLEKFDLVIEEEKAVLLAVERPGD